MQLTKLDRWLKERFIYETHIFTLRLPECKLPLGVKVKDLEVIKSGDYRHKLIVKDNDKADEVIALLKENSLMYATHVVEGEHWYNDRIAPKGKSFTYRWILRFIGFIVACLSGWGIYWLSQHPRVVEEIHAAIQELKRGL